MRTFQEFRRYALYTEKAPVRRENGVTAYLRGVPYIKSFRLGEIGEGDTGVTIVDFK